MVEKEKIIGPTQAEIDEIDQFVKEKPEGNNRIKELQLKIAGGLAAAVIGLTACSPKEINAVPTTQPTESLENTPFHRPVETLAPEPTVQVEGPTIEGQSLNLGSAEIPLVKRNGAEIAEKIGANEKGWQVVTNLQGEADAFIGQEMVILPQGPEGYKWNDRAGVWQEGNNVVIPDVVIPGSFNQQEGVGGPLAVPDAAVLVKEGEGFKAVVLYDQGAVKAVDMDFSQESLTKLSDGGAMFVSEEVNKGFTLSEGEGIQRNPETGALEITNQDGEVVTQMGLRWSQVNSQQEAENLGRWVEVKASEQSEQEQAYLNSEDPGIQKLVEQGLKPEFYEGGGAVVKGEYDEWLAVWHEGKWLRLRNLETGGVPVETGIKSFRVDPTDERFRQASFSGYFVESYWNNMKQELQIDKRNIEGYEGWFWQIGIADQDTGQLKTFRVVITVKDPQGATPFPDLGPIIFQVADEGKVMEDFDPILQESGKLTVGAIHYTEAQKYLEPGFALGFKNAYIRSPLIDESRELIRVSNAACGKKIDEDGWKSTAEKNAHLLEERRFSDLDNNALLGLAIAVTVPTFDTE
jgi:hypothetical protein